MKTIKILLLCMIASILVNAQNVPPFTITEVELIPPKFEANRIAKPAPISTIGQYLATNFDYSEATEGFRSGTAVVQFTVNTSGELNDFKVINSVSAKVDKEVIRLLKSTEHMWIPGRSNGIPEPMEQEIALQVKGITINGFVSQEDFTKVATNYFNKGTQKLLIEGKTNKALKHFETAIRYQPYDKSLLLMRAICNAGLGHTEAARQDMTRINKLGGIDQSVSYLSENIKELEAYDILSAMITDE